MNDVLIIVIAFIVIVIIFGIVSAIIKKNMTKRIREYDNYEKDEKKYFKAMNSSSVSTINKAISDLDSSRNKTNTGVKILYEDSINELHEYKRDLEKYKWEEKADKYIDAFYTEYYYITTFFEDNKNSADLEYEQFKEAEALIKSRNACLKNYKKFYENTPKNSKYSIDLREYMKESLGEFYDSCMDSYSSLEIKLDEFISSVKQVLKKKKRLFKLIIEYVHQSELIYKTELLKVQFNGYSEKEIKCCYRELIKNNQIVELKPENRIFVLLSNKELAKHDKIDNADTGETKTPEIKLKNKIPPYTVHLSEHIDRDEEQKWFNAAGKHLAAFAECYMLIEKSAPGEYQDAEYLLKVKKKCLDEWQRYFAVDLYKYEHTIYPKRYMRKWMGNNYDPCMEDRYKLENVLSKKIQSLRSENLRLQGYK